MANEQVVALKEKAEKLLQETTLVLQEINALGFKVAPQSNNTLYVFKDTREAYGEIVPPPQKQNVVNLPPGVANAS